MTTIDPAELPSKLRSIRYRTIWPAHAEIITQAANHIDSLTARKRELEQYLNGANQSANNFEALSAKLRAELLRLRDTAAEPDIESIDRVLKGEQ